MTNQTIYPPSTGMRGSTFIRFLRPILANRFGLLAITAVILGAAAYSSWGWLVAIGIAPLLLSFAPCAAMCALGMCAMGGKKSDPAEGAASELARDPDAGSRRNLAPPQVIDATFSVLDKPAEKKTNSKKSCC